MVIDAIFFDWDGTLMDDEASWRRTVAATADAIAGLRAGIDPSALTAAYYESVEEVWDEVKRVRGAPWGNMDDRAIAGRVWVGALGRLQAAGADLAAHALASLDAQPARSLYVGDSPLADIGGANGAGMRSVWINRTGAKLATDDPFPDAEIASLDELPPLLDHLQA